MTIGFAMTGSFCTFAQIFPVMEQLAKRYEVIPIVSANTALLDSRFGTAQDHWSDLRSGAFGHHSGGGANWAEKDAGCTDRSTLHRKYVGEAVSFHCRYPGDHGGEEPSAERTSCDPCGIHQRWVGRSGGKYWQAHESETLLFCPLWAGRSHWKAHQSGGRFHPNPPDAGKCIGGCAGAACIGMTEGRKLSLPACSIIPDNLSHIDAYSRIFAPFPLWNRIFPAKAAHRTPDSISVPHTAHPCPSFGVH